VAKPDKILDLLFPRRGINRKLDIIIENQKTIMATQAEEAARIAAFTAQVRKAIDEITATLAALEEAVRNAPANAELTAAVTALGTAVQAADDIVPDAT
jgi:predicted ATP-dependent protease